MRTTFTGIEIARRAAVAQQRSLDTVAHNVANVNTPGYSRQRAVHSAANPYPVPSLANTSSNGQVGMGVQVVEVTQMRDAFAELRLRQELHNLGYWRALEGGLTQIERIFNEPSENAIDNALDLYWNSLQDLSQNPEDEAIRNVVIQRAEVLTETIRHTYTRMADLRKDINDDVVVKVNEINAMSSQIANLNREIAKVAATGNNPNDLIDSRNYLLEQLSEITDIDVMIDDIGMAHVTLGGIGLVNGFDRKELFVEKVTVSADNTGQDTQQVNGSYSRNVLVWRKSDANGEGALKAEIRGGELGGMLEFRDNRIETYMTQLNDWARDMMNSVNFIHSQGHPYPGSGDPSSATRDFFVSASLGGSSSDEFARNIYVNRQLAANVWQIRASSVEGSPGSGANALDMAKLRYQGTEWLEQYAGSLENPAGFFQFEGIMTNQAGVPVLVFAEPLVDDDGNPVLDGNGEQMYRRHEIRSTQSTLAENFNAVISGLGVRTQEAKKMLQTEEVLVNHLQNLKEATAGVNLDEEMADMIRFQHAYNAAARLMSVMDEALDVIINRFGVVGR